MRKVSRNIVGFFLVLFFILEWGFALGCDILKLIHEGVKELATALEIKYNSLKTVKGEPDSGKE